MRTTKGRNAVFIKRYDSEMRNLSYATFIFILPTPKALFIKVRATSISPLNIHLLLEIRF